MDDVSLYLVLFVLCLMASAFFSSSETAFISLQKIRMIHLERTGVSEADRVTKVMKKPERLLTGILLGNNFFNTAAAALATAIVASTAWGSGGTAVIVSTLTVTVLLLVFAEVTPKTIATQHSEKIALLYARPIQILLWIMSPAVTILTLMGTSMSKLFHGTPALKTLVTEGELRTMISIGMEEGVVEKTEAEMLNNVFEVGDRFVREVMTPRPDIAWIEKGMKLTEFFEVYSQTPHSRFPVFEENADKVIGIISIKDILMAQAMQSLEADGVIDDLIRPILFVPDSKRSGKTLTEMQTTEIRMAIVIDEYGCVDGIVTVEQLLEEIVGHIGDELSDDSEEFETIDDATVDIDGGVRVDEANEKLGLNLLDGDYETVAGFVLACLGRIPTEGDEFKYGDVRLVVTKMRGMRIEKIRVFKGR